VNPATGASYALWLYPNEKIVRLYRTVAWNIDSGFTQIGQASVATLDALNYHTLKLSFKGTTIQVFVDNISLIAATDTTLTSGFVALDVSNQIITFNNVFVSGSVASADSIAVAPASLSFAVQSGGGAPAAQSLQLSSSGGVLAWTAGSNAAWLTASVGSGVTPVTLSITANPAGLSSGTYNGTIQVVALGALNSAVSVPVTLVIAPQPVIIAATPASLSFLGASTTLNPVAQTLSITNAGLGAMSWSASSDSSWLSVAPGSGNAPSGATVNATSIGLAPGQYSGNVIVSSAAATNTPLSVPATMRVGPLLFSDDFSGGAGNWLISPLGLGANWSVVGNSYVYNGGGATQSYTGSQSWTDYSFSTDVKLSSTSNYPGGIRARLNLSTGAGYGVWFYPGYGLIKLFAIGQWNIDSGSLSLVAQAPLAYDTNIHNVRIDLHGSDIRVFVDNVQVIQVTDTTFTSGGVAFDVSNQPIQYDNVRVISF
jgi:hypothetical protein